MPVYQSEERSFEGTIPSLKFCFIGQRAGSHKDCDDSEGLIIQLLISVGVEFHSKKEKFAYHFQNGMNM